MRRPGRGGSAFSVILGAARWPALSSWAQRVGSLCHPERSPIGRSRRILNLVPSNFAQGGKSADFRADFTGPADRRACGSLLRVRNRHQLRKWWRFRTCEAILVSQVASVSRFGGGFGRGRGPLCLKSHPFRDLVAISDAGEALCVSSRIHSGIWWWFRTREGSSVSQIAPINRATRAPTPTLMHIYLTNRESTTA